MRIGLQERFIKRDSFDFLGVLGNIKGAFRYGKLRRRDGRAVEGGSLENYCGVTHRGFESLSLRFYRGL